MSVISLERFLVGRRKNILVVDDAMSIRLTLSHFLKKLGFQVFQASNGVEALELLQEHDIPVIISDWEMPEMNGIEFCLETRKRYDENEHYIIILTANTQKSAIKSIFDAGGNDYLTKPIDMVALSARLLGGLRITTWRDDLKWSKAQLEYHKQQLDEAYARIKDDLIIAASVQRRHVPQNYPQIGTITFAGAFLPAFYTAGDIFNYVQLNDTEIAVFSVDVSGHGIASSLLAVSVSETLCANGNAQPILFEENDDKSTARSPEAVVYELNKRFVQGETDHYLTINYGVINLEASIFRLCQAGHPPLLLIREDGSGHEIGRGGMPVGLFEFAEYDSVDFKLQRGDRVYLFSDGIPESENSDGDQFGEGRMIENLTGSRSVNMVESISSVIGSARSWQGADAFNDDVSIIGFEFSY